MFDYVDQPVQEALVDPESDPALSAQSSLWHLHALDCQQREIAAEQFDFVPRPPESPPKGKSWKTKRRLYAGNLRRKPWKYTVIKDRPKPTVAPEPDPRLPYHYQEHAEPEPVPPAKEKLTLLLASAFERTVTRLLATGFSKIGVGTYEKRSGRNVIMVRTLTHTTEPDAFWLERTVFPQP